MKERPILFSAPMVRAILSGSKTQTRREVKHHPSDDGNMVLVDHGDGWWPYRSDDSERPVVNGGDEIPYRCPYGQPGDRLWVRENGWERPERTPKMMREGADTWAPYYFDADYEFDATRENEFAEFKEWGFKRRPSIHMPRWASRILLEITAVRVERLNEISEADAMAEGITTIWPDGPRWDKGPNHYTIPIGNISYNAPTAAGVYSMLWEQINGAGSWAANPFVWVISFRRVAP